MRPTCLMLMGAVALSGCALLGKNEPLVPRYFTPEYEEEPLAVPLRHDLQLRLGRIEGWSHLRERIAARNAARELRYYEDRRWAERPELYLRHALSRALFEQRGLVETLSGRAITLDVELVAFEEVEQPHKARMQALLLLRDDRTGFLSETITVEESVTKREDGDQARAMIDAFALALHAGVTRIADRVVARLAEQTQHVAR